MATNLGDFNSKRMLYSDFMIYSDLLKLKMNTLWEKRRFVQ